MTRQEYRAYQKTSEYRKKMSKLFQGHSVSDETRKKISESVKTNPTRYWQGKSRPDISAMMKKRMKGYKPSPETVEKTRKRFTGATNPRWKGGITPEDRKERLKFRHIMQQKIFARDNYTCQICDAYGSPIQVDHIKGWAKHPELRFEESNCRTVCMACHYYVTFKRKLPQGVVWGHNLNRRMSK